jgi:heptosyltransferase III
MPGKILVIRGGAIGDFILTLPVLAALRARFPAARLAVLGYPHIAQLALAGGLADELRSIEAGPLAGFFARGGHLDERLQEYFAGCAVIISYLYDPDDIFQTNVARCTKAQFINGPHRPNEKADLHATRVLLAPLERLAIFDSDPVPRLLLGGTGNTVGAGSGDPAYNTSSPTRAGGGPAKARPTLALHPGSGSERKNWPEPQWAGLLRELATRAEFNFLLVGGEAEGARLDRLAALLPAARTRVARSLPLAELARQLSGCAGFVGHDSGISHLAAALGLPMLLLWGHTAEAVWQPQGPGVRVLRHPGGLAALPVRAVLERVEELMQVSARSFGGAPSRCSP